MCVYVSRNALSVVKMRLGWLTCRVSANGVVYAQGMVLTQSALVEMVIVQRYAKGCCPTCGHVTQVPGGRGSMLVIWIKLIQNIRK